MFLSRIIMINKSSFIVILVLTMIFVLYIISTRLQLSLDMTMQKSIPINAQAELHKYLSRELHQIHGQIVELALTKNPKLVLKYEEILQRIDNANTQSQKPRIQSDQKTNHLKSRDVCPEVFEGTQAGYPYYEKGWTITNCANAKPIQAVITILINSVTYSTKEFNRLSYVLDGIKKSYPTVAVLVAIQDKQVVENGEKYTNVKVFKSSLSSSKTWNMLIKKASTQYVLIARDVVHFSWLSQLERQIRVVSEITNVGVAGGSYRNLSGHWTMGCFQSNMKNYVLEYQEGYFYSRNECMICDYLQGPFVARKSILNFDEKINDEVLFEDLFLSLVQKGTLIMGCPDAMYFTREIAPKPSKVWKALAKKWVLNRIKLSNGGKHSFSCKDIDFKCSNDVTRSYLLPVCCQELYEQTLGVLQDFANQNNFSFELDTGSTLGTVKFNGLMPWDADGDIRVLTKQINIFTKKETIEYFKKRGILLLKYEKPTYNTENYDGYVKIQPTGYDIDVWGRKLLTCPQFLPEDLQDSYTLAQVRGTWVKTVFSPGLFVRNRYGVDVLKHSQSWGWAGGMEHSYSDYKPGKFTKCADPKHHSCLDHFPGDGNIPFLVP